MTYFLFSLILGLAAGGLLLGAGSVAAETAVFPQLGDWLGLGSKTAWYLTRSAGVVAYILLAASTIWGILLSSKIIKEAVPAALALATHNILSWLAIAFTGGHVISLLFDTYFSYTVADLLIPFIGPFRPGWVGMGVIAMYVMLLTTFSFYVRKQIGQKWWRRLHFLTFAAYALVTVHGFMAGTDSGNPGMRLMYVGSTLIVLFLTNYRLLFSARGRARASSANRRSSTNG
jgi:DMSO/TMAO reductase YedYZ heme-binding membrane subunit